MKFPEDHFQHNVALEWWCITGNYGGKFFLHALFKRAVGRERRLWLHTFRDGKFKEFEEDEISNHGYSTGFSNGSFFIRNNYISVSLFPVSDPVIHRDVPKWKYYSIMFLKGKADNGEEIDAWIDHEYYTQLFNHSKKPMGNFPYVTWDWIGIKYKDGTVGMKADGRYSDIDRFPIKGELVPLEDEVIFNPNFGFRYSEQPIKAMLNGETIGFGVRERSYIKDNWRS
jgi:hypothetical protein